MTRTALLALTCAALAACHHATQTQTIPAPVTPPATAAAPAPAPAVASAEVPASPNVAVDGDLAKACALAAQTEERAPKFDYNEAQLLPEDRAVLDQIAICVTSGPLRGRHLQLTGRADPRGTDEYNLSLGTRRATMVSQYLARLGVNDGQLASTTRGALDARGTDESGWRIDRRVDIRVQ